MEREIATESSHSVIRYGFETLNFQAIQASTDIANAASIRVLEKLGMACGNGRWSTGWTSSSTRSNEATIGPKIDADFADGFQ
jgi:Acetyltransferase (GNAT) domain